MANILCSLLLCVMTPSVLTLRGSSSSLPEGGNDPQDKTTVQEGAFFPSGDFLLVSSTAQKKVYWTRLTKHGSEDGKNNTLLEGFKEPKGIAFDRKNGFLYVADSGAGKIFRSTLIVTNEGAKPALQTTGVRITVADKCGPVEWVTLDSAGNLFYSAPKSNNINKIPLEVMFKLTTGEVQADQLERVSQKTIQTGGLASAQKKDEKKTLIAPADFGMVGPDGEPLPTAADAATLPIDVPPPKPHILSIYEAKLNKHVAKPAAIQAYGEELYWTNMEDGKNAGTVVRGQINPKVEVDKNNKPLPFPADALTTQSTAAVGLAKAGQYLFFVRKDEKEPDRFILSNMNLNATSMTVDTQKSLVKPKALIYDGDSSIYVADETQGAVFSFPADRFMANVPLKPVVEVEGAYGLAILNSEDECFVKNNVEKDTGFTGGQTPEGGDLEKEDENATKSEEVKPDGVTLLQGNVESRSNLRRQQVHSMMLASIVAGV